MRRLLLFLTIPLLIYSCNNNKVVIKGELENPKGTYVYLQELTADGMGKLDSMVLSKSGSFKFKKEVTSPMFYTLSVGKGTKHITLLAKPGERIKIYGSAENLFKSYQVEGSFESRNVQLLTQHLDKTKNCLDSLVNVYRQFLTNKNIANIRVILSNNYQNCIDEQRQFSIAFIKKDPGSLSNLLALYQRLDSATYVLDKEDDFKYFLSVDSALYKKYKESPQVAALHANIQQLKDQKQTIQMQRLLSVMGAPAPEISLPNAKGDTVRLSSLKGKVILVYFWASWNPESRKESAELTTLYNKYKSKGFEIYQAAIDKNKEAWQKAVKEDGLRWTQVCDGKYWQSPVVNLYNFDKLPTSFLIDQGYTIVSRDLKGEELDTKISSLFEAKSSTTGK